MNDQSYTATIEVAKSTEEVFNDISHAEKWWATDEFKGVFEGQSKKLNDEFIVRFGDVHYTKQKLIEVIPDKKVVWLVTDSKINWIVNDKREWTNTKMIFDLTPNKGGTVLKFTHDGLIPQQECYDNCVKGWNMVIKEWLFNYITTGKFK